MSATSSPHAPEIQAELAKDHKQVTSLLLITGPRKGVTKDTVAKALRPHFSPEVMLVEGEAGGVDKDAASLWEEWGGPVERHPVSRDEWEANPKGAGHARNDRMVQRVKTTGGRVLVIDLPCTDSDCEHRQPHNTHGTANCAEKAERAGLKVEHYAAPVQRPAAQPSPRALARHSWTGEHTRVCDRDGCGMTARQHWLPNSQRQLTIYEKDGRSVVSERVPRCGQPLPESSLSQAERGQLANQVALQAKAALQAGDHDRAIRQLAVCRVLDPSRDGTWSQHEQEVRCAHQSVTRSQPGMQSANQTRVWLGSEDSGEPCYGEQVRCSGGEHEFIRPHGATYETCLKCQTGERIIAAQVDPEAAGLPPGIDLAPEIELARQLNARAVARHLDPQLQPRLADQQPAVQPARQIQMEATA
jgi:hypothetical protein